MHPIVTDGRKRITRVLAGFAITALAGSTLTASPSAAEPEISDVQAKVDRLYHEAEVASEQLNDARVKLGQAQTRLDALRSDLRRTRGQVEEIRRQVVASVVGQSQGQVFSSASQVALSDSPDEFLEQLVVVSQYNDQQHQVQAQYLKQARQLQMRREEAGRELADIARTKKELATHKATIDEKAGEATKLLHRLKAEAAARAARAAERAAARASRSESRPSPAPAPSPSTPAPTTTSSASGRAAAAVDYAMAQVGDAYVWGATGPDAFDCSGLTLMAWAQAGVSLPHSSSMQMSSGASVASSDLQPGDLVFYYSPVSHVGIYIGNGQIVHAANPTSGVEVSPVFSMPFSGAVRPG